MNAYFEQLMRQTSLRLSGSQLHGQERAPLATWQVEPLQVQDRRVAAPPFSPPASPTPSQPPSQPSWQSSPSHTQAPTRPQHAAHEVPSDDAAQRPGIQPADRVAEPQPSAARDGSIGHERGEMQSLVGEQAPNERSHGLPMESPEVPAPDGQTEDAGRGQSRQSADGAATSRAEAASDPQQQWWAQIAELREWVAESPDPPAHGRPGPARGEHGAAPFHPRTVDAWQEQDFGTRDDKAPASQTTTEDGVQLSIGSIQLIVEAPAPAPPEKKRPEPRSGPAATDRPNRLSRYYLRR